MGSDFDYDGNKDMRITLEREIDEDLRLAVSVTYTRNMAEAPPDNLHERLVGSLDHLMNQFTDQEYGETQPKSSDRGLGFRAAHPRTITLNSGHVRRNG